MHNSWDESLKVVEPQTADWQKLDNGFGDDSYGYPMDEHVREMIYAVWDDGAKKQMGSAERLYQAYEALIKQYIPDALKYLERIRDDTFQKEIAEAKKNGWDASIIKKRQLEFPYVNLATS